MERSTERPHRCCYRRVHVREGGRDDACGESRRIHRVIGVQDQAFVEDLCCPRLGWASGDLKQEVAGDTKGWLWLGKAGRVAAGPGRVVPGYEDRHLGDQAYSLTLIR